MSFRLLINSGNFVAKLVFARRIFPTLGNANEFPLLSLNGKIAMPKTTYQISLKGHVGGIDFGRSDVDAVLAENEGKQVNVLIDSLDGSLASGDWCIVTSPSSTKSLCYQRPDPRKGQTRRPRPAP